MYHVCTWPSAHRTCLSSPQKRLTMSTTQLMARGSKIRAWLGWPFFGRGNFILKTMMFHDVRTALNEIKHLKMVIRSVPASVRRILGRTEWPGLTALHHAQQVDLLRHRTCFKYSCHQMQQHGQYMHDGAWACVPFAIRLTGQEWHSYARWASCPEPSRSEPFQTQPSWDYEQWCK